MEFGHGNNFAGQVTGGRGAGRPPAPAHRCTTASALFVTARNSVESLPEQFRLNINWLSGMAKRGELSRASVELHIDQDDLGAVLVFDRALCSLSTNSFSVIPKSGMHLTQLSKVTAVVCLSRTTSSRPKPMRMPA